MTDGALVDSCIWSLAFRHRKRTAQGNPSVQALEGLIEDRLALIIGPVRQEVLSGFSKLEEFSRLDSLLHPFSDEPVLADDYREAARHYNRCRAQGIQGSHVDFLICAVALRLDVSVFTTDRDFIRYQPILGFRLHGIGTESI